MKNSLTIDDSMKGKKALEKANVPMTNIVMSAQSYWVDEYSPINPFSLGNCVTATPMPCQTAACNNKQGNKPMYVDNDKHIESSKINYLTERLESSFYTKERTIDA